MHARMVLSAALLATVCFLTPQLDSTKGFAQQSTDVPGTQETAADSQPLVDTGELTLDAPAAVDPPRLFARTPPAPTRSVLRSDEATSSQQPQNPENSPVPQPLRDPADLRLPLPSPTRVQATSPAPLSVDVSSDLPPYESVDRPVDRHSSTETPIPIDVNVKTMLPTVSIETACPAEINVGRTAKYVIAVKNHGDIAVESLKVIATLPEQVELTNATPKPTNSADGELHFHVGTLGAKDSSLIELQLVPRETGAIDLATRASFAVSTHAAMQVRRPQLVMTCEAPDEANYGDTVTFVLVVTNVGDGMADGVVITPQLPSHEMRGGESDESMSVGWLRPGDSQKVPVTASAVGPGVIEGRFTATDASGSKVSAAAKVRVRRAVVEVAADGPRMNFLGREAVYEIRVSNPGDAAADNVKVVASLPAGLQLTVLGRPVHFDRNTNIMTWHIDSLGPGVTERLPFKLKAVAAGEQVQEITASAARGLYSDTRYLTQVSSRPKINVAIASKDGPLAVGDAAEFQVGVQNVGTKAAEGIRVKVITPDALQAVVSDDYVSDGNQLTFSPMTLAVGQTKRILFRAVGREEGDHVVRVVLESQSPSYSLSAETSAFFYSSQDEPRVTSLR